MVSHKRAAVATFSFALTRDIIRRMQIARLSPRQAFWLRSLAMVWLLVLASIALVSALAIVSASSIWDLIPGNTVTPQLEKVGILLNLLAISLATTISILVGRYAPRYWRGTLLASAIVPFPVLALLSGRMAALCVILALLLPTCTLGRQVTSVALQRVDRLTAWAIGTALGLGLIGYTGFLLGLGNLLHAAPLWALLALTTGVCFVRRAHIQADVSALIRWLRCPIMPRLRHCCLIGIGIGFLWINFIGALTPETATDATWQRLATAVHFARSGNLTPDDPDLIVAAHPALGEIMYAVGLTIGPLPTAKLLDFIVGACCAGAIFALGRRFGGTEAGILSAFIFYTMPLVDWLSQIAFLDLFLTLFALAAALIIMHIQTVRPFPAIVVGVCCGLGIAVKLHFAYVVVGLAVCLGLALLRMGGVRVAIRSLAIMSLATLLVCGPLLIRSAILSGDIPGLTLGVRSLQRGDSTQTAVLGDLVGFGFGRSLANLALLPLDLTLHSYRFEVNPTPSGPFGGLVGYLLLASLPFLPLIRPRRMAIALLSGTLVALLLWFFTAQYLRYALSILALFCPLAGGAYAGVKRIACTRMSATILNASLLVLICAGLLVQMRVPLLGWEFAIGRENESAYLTRYTACCSGYTVLRLLEQEPRAMRALASAGIARVYSRIRISTIPIEPAELDVTGDEKTVLDQLDAGGFSHIIVSRQGQSPLWDRMTVFDQGFLRRNALLVGGDARAYLYRLLPADQRGKVSWTIGDNMAHTADGRALVSSLIVPGERTILAATEVNTVNRYLLTYSSQSMTTEEGSVRLQADWSDGNGVFVGSSTQRGRVSKHAFRDDIMLLIAPSGATTATVSIQVEQGRVALREVSIRTMADDAANGTAVGSFLPATASHR